MSAKIKKKTTKTTKTTKKKTAKKVAGKSKKVSKKVTKVTKKAVKKAPVKKKAPANIASFKSALKGKLTLLQKKLASSKNVAELSKDIDGLKEYITKSLK